MSLKYLGPYRIEKLLGQGGMGAVYAARDDKTGRRVAVKAIPSAKSQQEVFKRRFDAETTALTKLEHPNIVRILAHGASQGYLYLAMELIDGPSLYDYFRKKRFLPWAEVIGYMLDVCKGLKHAHDRGFIHRDLKLGNLLLSSSGQVKIADFGIARYQGVVHDELREHITAPGGVVGTYDYMSPEQLRGEPATVRSDLYSLGVVMYVLLTGRTPFSFKNVNEAIELIRKAEITPVSTLAPDMPPRLEKVVMRLLDKDPQNRYSSADTVGRRLLEIIDADADVAPSSQRSADEPADGWGHEEFELSDEVHQRRTLIDGQGGGKEATQTPGDQGTPATVQGSGKSDLTAQANAAPEPRKPSPPEEYFSAVSEAERGDDAWRTEEPEAGPVWPYLLGLLLVLGLLGVGLYFAVLRSPSADQQHEAITAAVARGDSPEQLEDAMIAFVERFPNDPRSMEFNATLTDLEARRLPRRLQMQLNWQNGATLSDLQRGFLDAIQLAQTRPAEADRRLLNIETLLSMKGVAQDESLLAAIRAERRLLSEVLEHQLTDRKRILAKLVEAGQELARTSDEADPSALADWHRQSAAALTLYGDDDRLIELKQRIERLRQSLPDPTTTDDSSASSEDRDDE
ncbi:MAG: protein kinase [Pirellulaceae bacterium]|nr:serine/threonine protein kinase [Planctomycetales bacterium]